jgi:hypothetical protein
MLQLFGLLLLLSSTLYLTTFSSCNSPVLLLLVNDRYLPVIMARNKQKSGSTANPKKVRSAEPSGSRRPGTPNSLGHLNEDGVAPHLDDTFGELEQDYADTKIPSAGDMAISEDELDLYAFFDGLSRAEKAKVLKPLMAKSDLKPSKEVHSPTVTPDHFCHPFDVNDSHEPPKKEAGKIVRKRGDHSALLDEWNPVGPERDIGGWHVPRRQVTDEASSDLWSAPGVVHHEEAWKQPCSPSWGPQSGWECPDVPKAYDFWGSVDQQHTEDLTTYPGKSQAHSNLPPPSPHQWPVCCRQCHSLVEESRSH